MPRRTPMRRSCRPGPCAALWMPWRESPCWRAVATERPRARPQRRRQATRCTPDRSGAREDRSRRGTAELPAGGKGGCTTHWELVNPDDATMVFLYYDLAGITPPIETGSKKTSRVKYAPAAEKAARRVALKLEISAGARAVNDVGRIRLSMNANLSEYDPKYGEFTMRALAPSSVVEFRAFDSKVSLRFANGQKAQIWAVPAAQAQEQSAIAWPMETTWNWTHCLQLRICSLVPAADRSLRTYLNTNCARCGAAQRLGA